MPSCWSYLHSVHMHTNVHTHTHTHTLTILITYVYMCMCMCMCMCLPHHRSLSPANTLSPHHLYLDQLKLTTGLHLQQPLLSLRQHDPAWGNHESHTVGDVVESTEQEQRQHTQLCRFVCVCVCVCVCKSYTYVCTGFYRPIVRTSTTLHQSCPPLR